MAGQVDRSDVGLSKRSEFDQVGCPPSPSTFVDRSNSRSMLVLLPSVSAGCRNSDKVDQLPL